VICLILGGNARDFHTQAVITGNIMAAEGIDDHHIFPAAYLERHGVAQTKARDCVLNRTLIGRATNQMISDRAPSNYLTEIRKTPGFPFESVLVSHVLPPETGSPLFSDDYEKFLSWRQKSLWQRIQEVTGATAATDVEANEKHLK
jgi:hypothetical protein